MYDHSQQTWLYPIHAKSEVSPHLQKFKSLVDKEIDQKIRCFWSNTIENASLVSSWHISKEWESGDNLHVDICKNNKME